MRTRLRLLPLLAAVSIGAVAVAGPAAADPAASSTSAAPTSAAPTTSAGPTSSAPTSAPAPTSTAAPTTTEAPVPTADPVPVVVTTEAAPTSAPDAAAPSTSSPRPTTRVTTTVDADLPTQPTTGGSTEAATATALAAGAGSAARDAARSAAEAEAGQLLVQGYVTRANRAAVVDLSAPVDVVSAALAEARTLEQLVADQADAVAASLTAAQDSRAAAGTALNQVLALPQTAAGVAEQTAFAQQVVTAAGVSVDRAATALAAVQAAVAPVQDAVATLSVRADRIDPASASEPLPDAAAAYALGAVVVLGFGVAGTAAVSARRTTVRRRVAAVRAGAV